jgi:hypothetical protein
MGCRPGRSSHWHAAPPCPSPWHPPSVPTHRRAPPAIPARDAEPLAEDRSPGGRDRPRGIAVGFLRFGLSPPISDHCRSGDVCAPPRSSPGGPHARARSRRPGRTAGGRCPCALAAAAGLQIRVGQGVGQAAARRQVQRRAEDERGLPRAREGAAGDPPMVLRVEMLQRHAFQLDAVPARPGCDGPAPGPPRAGAAGVAIRRARPRSGPAPPPSTRGTWRASSPGAHHRPAGREKPQAGL